MIIAILDDAGYEVLGATDGLDALRVLESVWVHLIISDILMPRLSGTELYRRLQKQPEHRTIPVLLISASSNRPTDPEFAYTPFLAKPFNPLTLIESVTALIGAPTS